MNYLLIGRPNVGKSSIYNILTRSNSNIVNKERGTTRDWHRGKIFSVSDHYIYDTPGIVLKSDKVIKSLQLLQNLFSKIDILIFVVDYKSSINPIDKEIIKSLRKYNKEILLIINKTDNLKNFSNNDFYQYGIKNVFFLSCSHKLGFDVFESFLTSNPFTKKKYQRLFNENYDYSIAIFGKPNSGKSTFLNTLLGYERSLTSSKAGTTSDFVTEIFYYNNT